jgi:beta-galactosidase
MAQRRGCGLAARRDAALFNAYDGCDPDVPYYRGNGWYRTHVPIANPFPKGRILLHFEGAGQTTAVYVGEKLAGKHTGGYDEFVFDITDLLPKPAPAATPTAETATSPAKDKNRKAAGVPIAVLCDNSRDLDRMPSDLSDFSLYGGMYRHVNLVYVPAVSLETVHVRTELPSPRGPAKIAILGTLYNPASATDSFEVSVEVRDAKGTPIHRSKQMLEPWQGAMEITTFTVVTPRLWSPTDPHLYECRVTLGTDSGYVAHETFGIRHTEFVDHGPFELNGGRLLLRGTHRHEDHAGYAGRCRTRCSTRRCSSSRTWASISFAWRTTSSLGVCSSTATGSAFSSGRRFPGAMAALAMTSSKRWAAAPCAT